MNFGAIYLKLPSGFKSKVRGLLPSSLYDILTDKFDPNSFRYRLPLGYRRFRKLSFAQQGEDLVLDRVLRTRSLKLDQNSGTFVDVGGYHPVLNSVTALLHLRGWQGVSFDASGQSRIHFKRYRPRDTFVRAVVGAEDGVEVPFFVASKTGDFSQMNTKYPRENAKYAEVRLSQISVSAELHRQGLTKVDVLCLDIEGAEFEVLSTFDFATFRPHVVVVEIHAPNLEAVLATPVARLLESEGYKLVGSCVITHFFSKAGGEPMPEEIAGE